MIENPFCSRKFHGEYDLVSSGRLDLEAPGDVATFVSYPACKDSDLLRIAILVEEQASLWMP